MKRFETKTSTIIFVAVFQVQAASSIQLIQRFDFFYKNNQFINFELYQRFFENDFLKYANDQCLYCFKNDYSFKKNCFVFQKNMTFQKFHIFDRRIFLKSQRSRIFQMRMWMKDNQCECVKFFEKFQYFVNLFAFVFAINSEFVFAFSLIFVVVDRINIITINIDFVKKSSFDEKNDFEIVILNHMSEIEIVILIIVAVQISKKTEWKKKKKKKKFGNK